VPTHCPRAHTEDVTSAHNNQNVHTNTTILTTTSVLQCNSRAQVGSEGHEKSPL